MDLDVLVYTNLYPEAAAETLPEAPAEAAAPGGGEAGAGSAQAPGAAVAAEEARHLHEVQRLMDRLTDPERQRAVINIDGGSFHHKILPFCLFDSTAFLWVLPLPLLCWAISASPSYLPSAPAPALLCRPPPAYPASQVCSRLSSRPANVTPPILIGLLMWSRLF